MHPKPVIVAQSNLMVSPDYLQLVRFLIEPFLESHQSLRLDCEPLKNQQRIWLRLAFESDDKGRVYGRGGRNIQAIRIVLQAAATLAGQSIYLDVYGNVERELGGRERSSEDPRPEGDRQRRPRHSSARKS
ncbi:MAG: KH domain-containing protein [Chloroflexaceae bacterium]|nr:KH domain-containing protein [Chloroflexaceae bacterium]